MKYLISISTPATIHTSKWASCALLIVWLAGFTAGAQQLKLGNNPTRFDSSAALEIESQKLALLLPRINDTSQMVKTVKDGSLIYFTNQPAGGINEGLYVRSSGQWNWLDPGAAPAAPWSLPGNSGTSSSVHFIGTTDNHPLLLKTNNLTRVFIDSTTGYTGFRTGIPAATLHNQGSTVLGVKALANFASGGMIGTASNTVDNFTVFSIPQTTASQTLLLPAPAKTTAGRMAILLNTGTVAFFVGTSTVNAGTSVTLVWTGTAWVVNGDGAGIGTFTVPYSNTPATSLGLMQGAAAATTGTGNVAIGWNALQTNSSGTGNIAIGTNAHKNSTTPDRNIAIGTGAMGNNTLSSILNIAIGFNALANTTATGSGSTAVGAFALASNTTGIENTALGSGALFVNTTGDYNTGVGRNALAQAGPGSSNNTAMGIDAAYDITGDGNTAFGAYALRNVTSGSNNTAIGYSAGYTDGITSSAASVTNSTAIGAFAQLTNSNTIILGSANPAYATRVGIGLYNPGYKLHVNGTIGGSGAFVNASDGRLKKNVLPVQQALDKIKALRGVRFNWNQEAARQFGLHTDTRNHYGFIAQEVEKILPEVVHTGTDAFQVKTIAYTDIIPVLTAALREQQPALDNLLQQHERMQQRLALLQQQLDTMEKQATP